jgi:hypothetical protein
MHVQPGCQAGIFTHYAAGPLTARHIGVQLCSEPSDEQRVAQPLPQRIGKPAQCQSALHQCMVASRATTAT